MKLLIVESPTKCRTINKLLPSDFVVKASMGHIKDLPPKRLGVDIQDNFNPEYHIIKGKKKIVEELKSTAKEAETIYLAADPDREGEAISWHLQNELNGEGNQIFRLILNEITKQALIEALCNPKRIDKSKVDAQQARRILDRLVGYKLSPLLWKKVRARLSAGRVQSVAVKLICDREKEIEGFHPQEYWTITARLSTSESSTPFDAKLHEVNGEEVNLREEAEAKALIEKLSESTYLVSKITRKMRRRKPSPPFTTSTLQQEAARKLKFTPKRTMRIAQQLYEGLPIGEGEEFGLITYMRTDSVRVSEEAVRDAREYIKIHYGKDYLPKNPPKYKEKAQAQGAHEAIRPTTIHKEPDNIKPYLTRDQYLLYKLIWERFLSSQMKEALMEITTVLIVADGCTFKVSSTKVLFPGFTLLYLEGQDIEEEEKPQNIPPLTQGMQLHLLELIPKQHFTKPPPRFSAATLVKTLEELGIGRPSTYAPIISTIQERGYVKREEGRFFPTKLGMLVNSLLEKSFPDILNVRFTAEMEENLDRIEQGAADWVEVLKEFWNTFKPALTRADEEMKEVKAEEEEVVEESCPECGGEMKVKFGKFGKFLACSNFPNCKYTQAIKLDVSCPIEGCGGVVVERRSRKGRIFFGCSNYPECNFRSWDEPVKERCPECGANLARGKRKVHCLACTYIK